MSVSSLDAAVAEQADARDLKSLGGNTVPVRSRSAAPVKAGTPLGVPAFTGIVGPSTEPAVRRPVSRRVCRSATAALAAALGAEAHAQQHHVGASFVPLAPTFIVRILPVLKCSAGILRHSKQAFDIAVILF